MIVTFRIRRDTAANWTSANPVLGLGEPGLETDTRRVKYGDGSTPWNGLAYSGSSGTVTSVTVVSANGVSATVANQGTTPALTFTLGAITPSSVSSSGTVRGGALVASMAGATAVTTVTIDMSGVSATGGGYRLQNGGAGTPLWELGTYTSRNRWGVYFTNSTVNNGARVEQIAIDINGVFYIRNAPTYANDAAAASGGLGAGAIYKTSDGNGGFFLKIKA